MLTEEESMQMKENLAQEDFGMSLEEFTKAWLAGEFDGDRERHGRVIALAIDATGVLGRLTRVTARLGARARPNRKTPAIRKCPAVLGWITHKTGGHS